MSGSNQYFTKYSPEDTENMVWVAASPVGAVALLGVGILGLAIINSKNKKAKWPSSGPSMPNMDASKAAEKGQTAESAQGADSQTTPATPPLPPLPPDDDGNKKKDDKSSEKKDGDTQYKEGDTTDFTDITKKSSRVENMRVNRTKPEVEKALEKNGYEKSVSKDGHSNIYKKSGKDTSYSTRNQSSEGNPTLDVNKGGKTIKKIRLKP